ncbi:hypothetical protein D3C85_1248740 [compost metagenome]
MTANRISHMESCIHCGTTTSSGQKANDFAEQFADRYIGLAVRSGDVAALHEMAKHWIESVGGFGYQSGGVSDGPSALYKLRRIRMARKAMEAAEAMLLPVASDVHEFDQYGHKV